MSRLPVFREAQMMQLGWRFLGKRSAAILMAAMHAPSGNRHARQSNPVFQNCRVRCSDRFGGELEILRPRCPKCEQIRDANTSEPHGARTRFAPSHRWIIPKLVCGRGVEHNEQNSRSAFIPDP